MEVQAPDTEAVPVTLLSAMWLRPTGSNAAASSAPVDDLPSALQQPPQHASSESCVEPEHRCRPPPGLPGLLEGRPPPPPIPGVTASSSIGTFLVPEGIEGLEQQQREGAAAPPAEGGSPRTEGAAALPADGGNPRKQQRQQKLLFESYWESEEVQLGLQSGALIKGTLRVSAQRLGTAYVRPLGAKHDLKDFTVRGKEARNRAVHGDVVVIKPIDEDIDNLAGDVAADPDDAHAGMEGAPALIDADDDSSASDEEVVFGSALVRSEMEAQHTSELRKQVPNGYQKRARAMARVVAIADPKGTERVIVCTLHPNDVSSARSGNVVREEDQFVKAKPTDKRMPWILLQINDVTRKILNIPGKLDNFQLWPVQMQVWKETSSLPLGRLKGQCLGKAGELEAEERHALTEHDLYDHDIDFTHESLDEVDTIVAEANASFDHEIARRHDLRTKRIFTIDPATARDLDDAIHVDLVPARKQVEVGVHIADVGHFLKMGTTTDTEAQRRTTSVYLINRVLPMLPHGLCNHLCSLNPNEPKLTFSVFFRLDLDSGELCDEPAPWFQKTAICSCCRLNYEEVQQVLDGESIEEPPVYGGYTWSRVRDDIMILYDVCGKVRRGRLTGGALTISKQKMIFHTRNSEDGLPTGYHLEEHSASHWIIEELMLLANRCVAKHLAFSRLSDVSVLRHHEPPDPKKAEELAHMLTENLGIEWTAHDAGQLFRSCQAIYKKYGEMLGLCVEMMVMRGGMQQAEYYVYGPDVEPHHYALNFEYYTHFTSPIRRYPDVMVHRVLKALLFDEDDGFQPKGLAEMQVEVCNTKKRAARNCNMQLDRAVFCIFLRKMKEWFYTVGTVLAFDRMNTNESKRVEGLTVYCSQLGRESKVKLVCKAGPGDGAQLFQDEVDDELLLPEDWRSRGRGGVELTWMPPDGDPRRKKRQLLQTLSCVPIVIIPINTVPIDYALFFVSPFHRRFEDLSKTVSERAARGFSWREADQEGVEVLHDALAGAA